LVKLTKNAKCIAGFRMDSATGVSLEPQKGLNAEMKVRSEEADSAGSLAALPFKPEATPRAFDTICRKIRDMLAAGTLKPGDKLPAERQLAEQLGVGRSALREALRTLEASGILTLKKGAYGGAFVREGDPSRVALVIQDLLYLGSISVDNLTEARVLLQDVIVRLACQRATSADLAALDKNVDLTEKLTKESRFDERLEVSIQFYQLLAAAAHNPVLSITVDAMAIILLRILRILRSNGVSKPQTNLVEKRRAFMDKLRAHDADAAAAELKAHLISVHFQLTQGSLAGGKGGPKRAPARRGKRQ
jgi:GntR family transcriptional repressor for pyruvate dehydrogenase complex